MLYFVICCLFWFTGCILFAGWLFALLWVSCFIIFVSLYVTATLRLSLVSLGVCWLVVAATVLFICVVLFNFVYVIVTFLFGWDRLWLDVGLLCLWLRCLNFGGVMVDVIVFEFDLLWRLNCVCTYLLAGFWCCVICYLCFGCFD